MYYQDIEDAKEVTDNQLKAWKNSAKGQLGEELTPIIFRHTERKEIVEKIVGHDIHQRDEMRRKWEEERENRESDTTSQGRIQSETPSRPTLRYLFLCFER